MGDGRGSQRGAPWGHATASSGVLPVDSPWPLADRASSEWRQRWEVVAAGRMHDRPAVLERSSGPGAVATDALASGSSRRGTAKKKLGSFLLDQQNWIVEGKSRGPKKK